MSRLVFVDSVADAPRPAAGTTVIVLDPAWTPQPGDRSDLVPIRPITQAVLDDVDVVDGSLAALDAWAAAAGLPDAFTVDGVNWWFRARMLLRWDAHGVALWRLVLDRIGADRGYDTVVVPASRPSLVAAARAGAATVVVSGARRPGAQLLRAVSRRAIRLARQVGWLVRGRPARAAVLERRLAALAHDVGGVVVLAWPKAFQVVREGDLERRVDPYLVGILDRLGAAGERVTVVGVGLDHWLDEDWALVIADPRLIPESFLVQRSAWSLSGLTEELRPGALAKATAAAVRQASRIRCDFKGANLGPSFAGLVAPYAGRWLRRQRRILAGADAALRTLAPAALVTDREGSRTAWLAAAKHHRVRSVAIQHGMIYPNNPEYFQGDHGGGIRPDVTCVFGSYERDLLVSAAGFAPDSVVTTGSPRPLANGRSDEAGRNRIRQALGVRPGDRLLLVSVAHNELMGELHTFGLLDRTLGGPLPGVHVVIKLHPQDLAVPRHDELLRGLARARGYEPTPLSIVRDMDLYALLGAADAHLGQYSTVLSDAVVAGTPNLIVVGQAHADALDYVGAGVAVPVRSFDEVRSFMADPRPLDPAARRRFLDAHYREGDAIGRLASVILGTEVVR